MPEGWWIHLLFYPLYQVLSTLRHELSHAVAAVFSGFHVTEISIFPSRRDGEWYWGYCTWEGDRVPSVHLHLAPYYVNVISLVFGTWFVSVLAERECSPHLLIASVIMLIISPAIDTCHALLRWLVWGKGDFAQARKSGS